MSELVYGRRAVMECLRAGRRPTYRLWLEESSSKSRQHDAVDEIVGLANSSSIPLRTVRGGIFDTLNNQRVNAQGVALEVDEYPYAEFDEVLTQVSQSKAKRASKAELPPLVLILDHMQDPQNLGALFRTAEAMAVDGVLIPDRRAAGITPAVVNASAGAVEHLQVAQVTNLNRAIDDLKNADFWIAGLEDEEGASTPDTKLLDGPLAVVVGSEGGGISRLTREKCDFTVRLPMYGRVESLNAAVAGSILLYLIRQAHRSSS